MTHLFDVNFLMALLDRRHTHYEVAHRWLATAPSPVAWATCPLTQNAFVRITGRPSYPSGFGSAAAALECLRENCAQANHTFWADDLSLLQIGIWTDLKRLTSNHLTDLYLLALAVKKGGTLVSFDRQIPAQLIRGGKEALLIPPV